MAKIKSIIVVPTIRGERISGWLSRWKSEFRNSKIIVVEDNPRKTFTINQDNVSHYTWDDIDKELKDLSWIIPRRTAAIRSYGFLKAYRDNPEFVITLDDDCYPDQRDFIKTHEYYLNLKNPTHWTQHAQIPLPVRGIPKKIERRECVMNMGLWSKIPDLDGETHLVNPNIRIKSQVFNFSLAPGQFAPISSMNLAFKTKIIPALYFLLMGHQWGFDRFDDIWAGIFIKRIIDHLGYSLSGGSPFVLHDRASDPKVNMIKEGPGIKANETLWRDVAKIKLTEKTFKNCYIELANQLPIYKKKKLYWEKVKKAMTIWAKLF